MKRKLGERGRKRRRRKRRREEEREGGKREGTMVSSGLPGMRGNHGRQERESLRK